MTGTTLKEYYKNERSYTNLEYIIEILDIQFMDENGDVLYKSSLNFFKHSLEFIRKLLLNLFKLTKMYRLCDHLVPSCVFFHEISPLSKRHVTDGNTNTKGYRKSPHYRSFDF